jgi:hypothetical protein
LRASITLYFSYEYALDHCNKLGKQGGDNPEEDTLADLKKELDDKDSNGIGRA